MIYNRVVSLGCLWLKTKNFEDFLVAKTECFVLVLESNLSFQMLQQRGSPNSSPLGKFPHKSESLSLCISQVFLCMNLHLPSDELAATKDVTVGKQVNIHIQDDENDEDNGNIFISQISKFNRSLSVALIYQLNAVNLPTKKVPS